MFSSSKKLLGVDNSEDHVKHLIQSANFLLSTNSLRRLKYEQSFKLRWKSAPGHFLGGFWQMDAGWNQLIECLNRTMAAFTGRTLLIGFLANTQFLDTEIRRKLDLPQYISLLERFDERARKEQKHLQEMVDCIDAEHFGYLQLARRFWFNVDPILHINRCCPVKYTQEFDTKLKWALNKGSSFGTHLEKNESA